MFRRFHSNVLKCPVHNQPVQYICLDSHVCNPEKNRAICAECLKTHNQDFAVNNLQDVQDFLSGDFIYSEMQRTIENFEEKLSEPYYERTIKMIEETFENLQKYFTQAIQDTKKKILENLKAKRFERHYILTSWKRLQENLESKLENFSEQNIFKNKELEEYIELFHEFKDKSRSEQAFSKLEEEFERKLFIEDQSIKEIKSSLANTLEGFEKGIWEDVPNLSKLPVLDSPNLQVAETIKVGDRGFRLYGLKYLKEDDKMLLCDRDYRLFLYSFMNKELKDLGKVPECYAVEYLPKMNKLFFGGKGRIYFKNLSSTIMGEDQQEMELPNSIGTVTCIKFLPEQGLMLCSGLFKDIYSLSLEENHRVIDSISTNEQLCSCFYYIKGKGVLVGGLENGHINVYRLKDKSLNDTLKGHTQRILSFDYNYVRDILVSGGKDGSIRVWMYRDNEFKCNQIIEKEKSLGVSSLQFINNTIIMSTHKDLYIKFWDALTGKIVGKTQVFQTQGHIAHFIDERRTVVAGDFEQGKFYILKFV